MNPDILEKTFGKVMTTKLLHAKQYVSPKDSVLEFSLETKGGNFAGFINTLLEDKTKHSVVLKFKDVDECTNFKELAKAEYSILTEIDDKEYTAVIVAEETKENLDALYTYLTTHTSLRLVIWEWKHSNENEVVHKKLHALLLENKFFPYVVGYENIYLSTEPPKEVKTIHNPPRPTISHNIYSVLVIIVVAFIMYHASFYFFNRTTPITKSLANNPI
jgi:hypothetical protein